ncbi:MAG: nitrous oxide-stimulated promoter family protein [Caldisericia bacterium]|nr:nitrous oxide-stimulated promoter family protein [Caldisericia bacterium]
MNSNSESKTIKIMIHLYCTKKHGRKELCQDCQDLLNYALKRMEFCPNKELKIPCNVCKIHCFKPEMRTMMKEVMKFSGPRMILKHPVIAINHLIQTIKAKRLC